MNIITGYEASWIAHNRGCALLASYYEKGPYDWHLFHGTIDGGNLRHVATFNGLTTRPHAIDYDAFMATLVKAADLPTLPPAKPDLPLARAVPEGFATAWWRI